MNLFNFKNPHHIKRLLAIILIIIGMIFVIYNKDVYYDTHRVIAETEHHVASDEKILAFQGDRTILQEFYGWDGELIEVTLRFDNQGNTASSGNISMEIFDENHTLLQSCEKPLQEVNMSQRTTFSFPNPTALEENQKYILQLTFNDVNNPQGFGVYTYEEKGDVFGTLIDNGEQLTGRLRATFAYNYYNTQAVIDMFILLLLTLLFVFIPFEKIDVLIRKKWNKSLDSSKIVTRILFFATPALCVMMADRINGYPLYQIVARIFTLEFVFNFFIYAVILLVIYTIINRMQYSCMITLTLAFIIDIANYYVWIFRGVPILATDLHSAKTAMNVAANFSYKLDLTGVWGVVYIISFLAIFLSLKGYKGFHWKKRLIVLACCCISLVSFNMLFFQSTLLKDLQIIHHVWKPQLRYAQNGTALSIVLSWTYSKVEKPTEYTADNAAEIMSAYQSDKALRATEASEQTPNIIAIMNESLADFSYNGEIELSEDYLPYLRSLKDNTIKGRLFVSIQGANTANSEFEFLTGNSMSFLPYRCIPYNLYINDTTPSMAQNMKANGYSGVNSYHPYLASGWNRTNVYPLMGFNNFYADEYFNQSGNGALVRNYISDEADFQQIIDDFEANRKETDTPFYLFNVTMQNHGGYDGDRGAVEPKITIENEELSYFEAEQYINLAKMSDDAFKILTDYFSNIDEPTLIVMFGDHQPPVTNQFYSAQFGCSINDLSTEQLADWYSTPYLIWANYDIEEKEVDMSANYLSSYVMNLANLPLTGFNKYLLELQKSLPVISAVCYQDVQGNFYGIDEESELTELIKEYQIIQYNELFGKTERINDFFFLQE